ncbi:TetR/AcrR family transcriptional regulator [Paenarthrobacter sp. CM16]|uniref:TetR/AcrR family transcriptional regulator n=1 Tax=Paenarthrobacter sp. CM16 TaxID=2738447 RepID=UPI0015582A1F|nr:TetR family transcriptional regulator [Paenarthrobacter sp. CM16]NQD89336.1 TetR/AcrR family transcriptional regulator [Paenarthrobacter sp. CM16]
MTKDTARKSPLSKRGIRTRQALVDAARVIFERDGYLDARLSDITAEAKCATGTFYTYFLDKSEIFAAVMEATKNEMLHPGMEHVDGVEDPAAIIESSNRAYLERYRSNAKLMQLLEQVSSIDPQVRELRRARGWVFVERNARGIKDLQDRGLADPDVDPVMASRVLSGMVSRLAFATFVLKDGGDFEQLVYTASRLWCNALRIEHQLTMPQAVEKSDG